MEKKDYKYKKGDKVILIDDEQRDLSHACYDFLTSRSYFIVNDVKTQKVKTKSGELKDAQYLDFGFKRKVKNKETGEPQEQDYLFPSYRFRVLDPSEIDWDDPFGEETFEVHNTFQQKVKKDEEEAKQLITKNITKTWIDPSFTHVVKVTAVDENIETYKYDIKFNTFKTKQKNNLPSAKDFVSNYTLLTAESLPKMESQLEKADKEYKMKVEKENQRFQDQIKQLEAEMKSRIDSLTKNYTKESERIKSIMDMCKNQK